MPRKRGSRADWGDLVTLSIIDDHILDINAFPNPVLAEQDARCLFSRDSGTG
jgi:hypothetical protein